ncbi:MAG: tetratricopeptide repeat protein, partial [candidate division WOR-3 bacterium]|nr:tetratricopeptide repeat protein [candidate division WOR-3 bacterium]
TKAIELIPELAEAYCNRGVAYDIKGEFDQAILDYTKAIELDPKDAKAMANMGRAYQAKGDKQKAKYWYEQALKYKERLESWEIAKVEKWLKESENQL